MLSSNLRQLAVWFDLLRSGEAELNYEGATAFRDALYRASLDAAALEEVAAVEIAALERRAAPPPAPAGNVVAFPRRPVPCRRPPPDGSAA